MRKIEREYAELCAHSGVELHYIEARKGHLALHTAIGTIFVGGTPSDRRNRANVLAMLRRLERS